MPEKAQRPVAYADKQQLEESILRRHHSAVAEDTPPQNPGAAAGGMAQRVRLEYEANKPIFRP